MTEDALQGIVDYLPTDPHYTTRRFQTRTNINHVSFLTQDMVG